MTTQEWLAGYKTLSYKWYGYEPGKEMLLKWIDPPDPIWRDMWMPVKVLKEYPKYILVEVQPHMNVNQAFGMSKPYRIGVNKMSLLLGDYQLKEDRY